MREEVTESERGMPGRQEPMKDVAHCEKGRGAVCGLRADHVRMGKPSLGHARLSRASGKGTGRTETSQYAEEKKRFRE